MIASVDGIIESLSPESVIVNVGGVGLQIFVPTSAIGEMTAGERVHLQTHLYLKEDLVALYGFFTRDELRLFQLLMNVSGIGPKSALKMLSMFNPSQLVTAIANEDADTLVRVPGIGRKTAARLSLELKAPLQKGWAIVPGSSPSPAVIDTDAVAALTTLGYTPSEARAALASILDGASLPLEEKLALALQRIGHP